MTAPSRTYSSTSIDTTASAQSLSGGANAALLGAATAFGRSVAKSRTSPDIPVNENGGARTTTAGAAGPKYAASYASSIRSMTRSPQSIVSSPVGSVDGDPRKELSVMDARQMHSNSNNNNHLAARRMQATKSPSQQAAVLASSRATQSSPQTPRAGPQQRKPAVAPKPRRLSIGLKKDEDVGSAEKSTDPTPIAPTTSLVSLFEQKSQPVVQTSKGRPNPIVIKTSPDLAIKSPKPLRTAEGITSMFRMELGEDRNHASRLEAAVGGNKHGSPTEVKEEESAGHRRHESLPSNSAGSAPFKGRSLSRDTAAGTTLSPGAAQRRSPSQSQSRASTRTAPLDIKPPPRPVTAQSLTPSQAPSFKSITAQYNHAYPKKTTPLSTGDALANALVASSLASSRAPSPRKFIEPPPPPTCRRKNHRLGFSRTPSPAKTGMLHTLRATHDETDDSDDDGEHPYRKHQKRRLVRKHPNKHHEGDRKRWRDAVTERERKRYEGVWAANKGLYCSFTPAEEQYFARSPRGDARAQELHASVADQVSNLIAREIWARSRLPDTVLETVWDLVDLDAVGRLSKEEFVVGMWLIDQRLKGRKLPVKVTESVWASVRRLQGIKVKSLK